MSSPRRKMFRPFLHLNLIGGGEGLLPGPDDLDGILPGRGTPHLLFGRYDDLWIREAFQRWGIFDTLKSQGLEDLRLTIDASDRGRQVSRLLLRPDDLLVSELILSEGRYKPADAVAELFPRDAELLVIQWICMQDPRRGFGAGETPLPGQAHPGLGLGRTVMEMLLAFAERLEVEGIVNRPEFLHNALLYEPYFLFLHPETQGRFDALIRDLGGLPLLELAWGSHRGAILDEASETDFQWIHAEQLRPSNCHLATYFGSECYQARRTAESARARFSMDRERLQEIMDQVRHLDTGVDQ